MAPISLKKRFLIPALHLHNAAWCAYQPEKCVCVFALCMRLIAIELIYTNL